MVLPLLHFNALGGGGHGLAGNPAWLELPDECHIFHKALHDALNQALQQLYAEAGRVLPAAHEVCCFLSVSPGVLYVAKRHAHLLMQDHVLSKTAETARHRRFAAPLCTALPLPGCRPGRPCVTNYTVHHAVQPPSLHPRLVRPLPPAPELLAAACSRVLGWAGQRVRDEQGLEKMLQQASMVSVPR